MEIKLREIMISDLFDGYVDNKDEGVRGYGGKLDIRPIYQREFIYKDAQRDAVMTTVENKFPLNVMYWALREDGTFEVIDGQQRTISICQYLNGDYSHNNLYYGNLPIDKQNDILNYHLMVYVCSGKDSEKLEWFKTINIAGEKLTNQELRNAVYSGTWVNDAKRYFSKKGCAAYGLGSKYLNGSPIRQEYLETAIYWFSNCKIDEYMAKHQHDTQADELWQYYQSVIKWVQILFPKYRKEMKGVAWGHLYNELKDKHFDAKKIEKEVEMLMMDDDVTKKSGIYEYVLTGRESCLNIRSFSANQKRETYERQKGICSTCHKHFEIDEMEGDHIKPWHLGGKTISENCQMLCKDCNRRKSGK